MKNPNLVNKHLKIFQRLQIAFALRADAIMLSLKKFYSC